MYDRGFLLFPEVPQAAAGGRDATRPGQLRPKPLETLTPPGASKQVEESNRRFFAKQLGLPPTAKWPQINAAHDAKQRRFHIAKLKLPEGSDWEQIESAYAHSRVTKK